MPASPAKTRAADVGAAAGPVRGLGATQVDPRSARFAATVTVLVLGLSLLLAPSTASTGLLAAQAAVFALGAVAGLPRTPYAWVFRTFVRPRLSAPQDLEDATPLRFAQAVGLAFALVALLATAVGAGLLAAVATGFALAAAFLNAAFGFCLGCEVYLLLRRATTA